MIDRLLDGELSEKEEQALRAHMESCEDCRRVYDAYRAVSDALADDLAEPPEGLVPVSFSASTRARRHGNGPARASVPDVSD
jgi:anti-sigma factor RsiW